MEGTIFTTLRGPNASEERSELSEAAAIWLGQITEWVLRLVKVAGGDVRIMLQAVTENRSSRLAASQFVDNAHVPHRTSDGAGFRRCSHC
jgi:hypothetical protein